MLLLKGISPPEMQPAVTLDEHAKQVLSDLLESLVIPVEPMEETKGETFMLFHVLESLWFSWVLLWVLLAKWRLNLISQLHMDNTATKYDKKNIPKA